MIFKYRKWSLNSIAAYYSLDKSFVVQTIKNFQWKVDSKGKRKGKVGQRTRKITKDHIESIGKFMIKNKGKHVTVEDI